MVTGECHTPSRLSRAIASFLESDDMRGMFSNMACMLAIRRAAEYISRVWASCWAIVQTR